MEFNKARSFMIRQGETLGRRVVAKEINASCVQNLIAAYALDAAEAYFDIDPLNEAGMIAYQGILDSNNFKEKT